MSIVKFFISVSVLSTYIFADCCRVNNDKNNNKFKKENNGGKENNIDKSKGKENNIDKSKGKKNKKNVILLTTGALNPIHKGHINMLKLAQDCLESKGFKVDKIYLSPSSDIYLEDKKNRNGVDYYYEFKYRLAMCKLAINDFKNENKGNEKYNIEVSDWEGMQDTFVDYPYVFKHFQDNNKDKLVFYVCGSDHYNNNVSGFEVKNVVVVKRSEDIISEKNNKNSTYIVVDNSNSDFISTKVRNIIKKIKKNNIKKLKKYLYKSVIKYILKL